MSEVRLLVPEGRRNRRQRGSEGEGMARDEGEEHKRAKIGTKDKKTNNFLFPRNNNVWLCCKNGAELNSQRHNLFCLGRIRMKQCSSDWADQRFDPLKDPTSVCPSTTGSESEAVVAPPPWVPSTPSRRTLARLSVCCSLRTNLLVPLVPTPTVRRP